MLPVRAVVHAPFLGHASRARASLASYTTCQRARRCRQAALVLGALGRGMRGAQQCCLALHAGFVVVCRGALFFPVCIDIAGHLFEAAGGRMSSEALVGPSVLIGCVHIAMILDAIKDAMFCASPAAIEPGRPLRAASDDLHDGSPALGGGGRMHSEAQAARKPSARSTKPRADKPRKGKKQKNREDGRGRGSSGKRQDNGVDNDEEMTFGFASGEFGSSYDNSLEDDNDDYDDDADDDASMTGEGPAATFRTRHSDATGNISPTDPLKDQPRFDGAGRMPPSKSSPPGAGGCAEPPAAASARARADDLEKEKARLRRELEDARREMDQKQQQQRDRRRAARDASARQASNGVPPVGAGTSAPRATRPVAVDTVDHAAIFATGLLPAKSNHYAMLGVPKSAGSEEIKKAYNKLAMKYHPDKNPADKAKAEVLFMGIKDAYECLSDPLRRRRYDR